MSWGNGAAQIAYLCPAMSPARTHATFSWPSPLTVRAAGGPRATHVAVCPWQAAHLHLGVCREDGTYKLGRTACFAVRCCVVHVLERKACTYRQVGSRHPRPRSCCCSTIQTCCSTCRHTFGPLRDNENGGKFNRQMQPVHVQVLPPFTFLVQRHFGNKISAKIEQPKQALLLHKPCCVRAAAAGSL